MDDRTELINETLMDLVYRAADIDIASVEATTAWQNVKIVSDLLPEQAESTEPEPEPTTFLGKVGRSLAKVWDNDTTRVLLKSGFAFAGVAGVAYTTIHKDHVVERQALAQANQSDR